MKVAINTSTLSNGHKDRGIGVYTRQLIDALMTYEKDHIYKLFEHIRDIPNDTDVISYPFFDPFFLTLPLYKPKPTVVTVHDLIPIMFPTHFPRGIRGEAKWRIQRWSLMGAKRIIADSMSTRKDVVSQLGFNQNRIDVVPLAASSLFVPTKDAQKKTLMKKKYNLSSRYALYVGGVNWNKNIIGLLGAWKRYKDYYLSGSVSTLVLAGKEFVNTSLSEVREINGYIKDVGLRDSVVTIGYVENEDLPILYQSAVLTIAPSLYEGFGLPVLEALASGGIVAASDLSSLPEVAGPSFTIDATNVDSIARVIDQISNLSSKQRASVVTKGLAWSSSFTWKKTAMETISSYEKALARK